jgi:enoyl-CoA hydratase/carnithine racemase/NifU-like protein involved in Fe-S cluster formation
LIDFAKICEKNMLDENEYLLSELPSPEVISHADSGRNLGSIKDPDGTALMTGPYGGTLEISLRIKKRIIKDIKFIPQGCHYTAACGDAIACLAKGLNIEQALKLQPEDIENHLGGLPKDYHPCAELAIECLDLAIADFNSKTLKINSDRSKNELFLGIGKMAKNLHLNQDCELFYTRIYNETVYLYFKENALNLSTSLQAKDELLNYLCTLSDETSFKVLALISPDQGINREDYINFIRNIVQHKFDDLSAHRLCNFTDQFIMQLVGLNQFVVCAFRGQVSIQFLNIGLACNHCLAAEDTVFQIPFEGMGMIPKGGGPYFLTKLLGCKKATDLLLAGSDISAQEARDYGLVNELIPDQQFEESIQDYCLNIARHSGVFLRGMKKLMRYSCNDLEGYLKLENRLFITNVDNYRNKEAWAIDA